MTSTGPSPRRRLAQEKRRGQPKHRFTEHAYARAEAGRAAAERTRLTDATAWFDAEQNRAISEETRLTAETQRESAEQSRAAAETRRQGEEQVRLNAETGRQQAEDLRNIAEEARHVAEDLRAATEKARQTAEALRLVFRDQMELFTEMRQTTLDFDRAAREYHQLTGKLKKRPRRPNAP